LQHQHETCRNAILVIGRTATPYIAVLAHGAERIDRPLFGLHANRVGVTEDQDGFLASVSFQSRDQVRAARFEREDLKADSLAIENVLQVIDYRGLIGW
jgi:hypothetical protein